MSNKDEYDYPDSTQADESYTMGSKKGRTETLSSQFAMLKNPRIIGSLIGFIVFSYLVSHLLSYLVGDKTKKVVTKPAVVQPVVVQPVTNKLAEQLKQQQMNLDQLRGVNSQVDSVQSISQANSTQLKQVRTKVDQLEDSISELSNNVSDLHYELALFNDKLKSFKQVKPKPIKKVIKKKKRIKMKKRVILKHYYIRAAVYGRAWLDSKNAPLITVKVGDYLPTYGKIIRINADQGEIATTSGRIIQYAKSDD